MEIFWTDFAKRQIIEISEYYEINPGEKVRENIINMLLESTEILIDFPEGGTIEPLLFKLNQKHRFLLAGHYKIIYRIIENNIYITDIFDVRQKPQKILRNKNINDK